MEYSINRPVRGQQKLYFCNTRKNAFYLQGSNCSMNIHKGDRSIKTIQKTKLIVMY